MYQRSGSVATVPYGDLLPLPEEQPAYLGLAHALRGMVMDGRLAVGARLPSERHLALELGLSRTTITRAYGELVESGWARARQGSGTTIHIPGGERSPSLPLVPGVRGDDLDLSSAAGPAPSGTAALVARALDWLPSVLGSAGYEPFGAEHLRRRIADAYVARGVPTDPDQVVVTPGALAALSIALHALLAPGERVLVDSPTYPGVLGAVAAVRARPTSIALQDHWDLAGWAAATRRVRPRAAYLIPDFHNPTGLLMDADERVRLARLLQDAGVVAIADETPAELGFGEVPVPAPWAATDPRAITVGSLSKVLWGGVRIGWLRCPPELLDALRTRALQLTMGASVFDQLIATTYLEEPDAIRAEVATRLRDARDLWRTELAERLPEWRVNRPDGGLALWVELPRRAASDLAVAAAAHQLMVTPGPAFSADRTHANRVRLPLTLPLAAIPEAAERLAAAWAAAGRGATGSGTIPPVPL